MKGLKKQGGCMNSFFVECGVLFFDKSHCCNKSKLLKELGVKPNSYFGTTFKRLYDYYFGSATDLKKEYIHYYKKEFDSFEKYLLSHFDISYSISNQILKMSKPFYNHMYNRPEQNLETLLEDPILKDVFWKCMGGRT